MPRIHEIVLALSLVGVLAGCAATPQRVPLPAALIRAAAIPGIPGARYWGDASPELAVRALETSTDAELATMFEGIYGKPHAYLAISGGGANGAYGAGFLVGWTAAGTRPEFTMVTGVSTGALIAPFAFLGAEYDDELEQLYTTMSTKDIAVMKGLLKGFLSDAMADTTPLRALIERYVSDEVIEAIAVQHRRGRRLWIGTANLDVGRPVIWDLGAIAASGQPGRARLIHDVLQASDFNGVPRKVLPIASRSIQALIRTQGLGDLYQIYALCLRDGNDFRLAHIPAEFTEQAAEDFDPVYMAKLFAHAYDAAKSGYEWRTEPPGFAAN